ncbi:MAG: phytanoyl-CoA dioxygenase family protein [Candidatus Sungiibacteriota bacterium]|uniref:Phytanoyl-CoA dioxygenase family protein n=1 Tax=Candidatus Sungiibacteriota bacterium TaxID=2750080 RepID=A0A7T5UQ35_9BACT|nr:MAG: phytanoyl-CoA dioxygenase family protein [Candidatus Sungbacteria bacterium]
MPSVLTEAERIFYAEKGYLVVNNLLSSDYCAWLLAIFEAHAESDFPGILNIELKAPEILHLIKQPLLVAIVEEVLGGEALCIGSQVLFKKPGTPFARHAWRPHQDNAYLRARRGVSLSAIFSLADSDPENGGMYLYPQSHHEPLLPFVPHPSFDPQDNPGNEVGVPAHYDKSDLYLPKGSLYVQHGNLIHGSYPNTSVVRSRPHFGIMYILRGENYTLGSRRREVAYEITLHQSII